MKSFPPTLVDMPKVVMEHILGELEMRSIITLRKVCTTLRDFIDFNDSVPQLQDLSIYVHTDNIEVWYYAPSGMDAVDYRSPDDQTTRVTYGTTVKTLLGVNYFESFMTDFKFFISRQKLTLRQFRVTRYYVDDAGDRTTVPQKIIEATGEILKNRPRPLPTEELYIGVLDQEELMKILPFLEVKKLTLNSNSNEKMKMEMEQVLKTEQWGRLENLSVDNFCLDIPIREIHHIGFVNLKVKKIEVKDLVELKAVFLATTKPKEFALTYKTFDDSEQLLEVFGPPIITKNIFGQETRTWKTPYSDDDDSRVLEIHHSRDWIKVTNLENFHEKVRKIREAAGQNLQDFLY